MLICVCAHACVFASVAYVLLAAAQQRGYVASCAQLILPHASYCHHYAKEFPAVSATAAHRVWVWRRERRRRRIKRHAAKQHWQIEDRAGFQSGFFSAKMCSACLRGKHYVCGIYCWPLCRWIVHICEKEHSVFMCVSDRACVWVSDCVACECLFPMRSERASRVCIVVLEEVEEDESCSSSPPPRPKSSPDRRSHHASQKVVAEDDKVRWDCLLNL